MRPPRYKIVHIHKGHMHKLQLSVTALSFPAWKNNIEGLYVRNCKSVFHESSKLVQKIVPVCLIHETHSYSLSHRIPHGVDYKSTAGSALK